MGENWWGNIGVNGALGGALDVRSGLYPATVLANGDDGAMGEGAYCGKRLKRGCHRLGLLRLGLRVKLGLGIGQQYKYECVNNTRGNWGELILDPATVHEGRANSTLPRNGRERAKPRGVGGSSPLTSFG